MGELELWPGFYDWYCPQNNVPFYEPDEEWIEEEEEDRLIAWTIKKSRKNKAPFVKSLKFPVKRVVLS